MVEGGAQRAPGPTGNVPGKGHLHAAHSPLPQPETWHLAPAHRVTSPKVGGGTVQRGRRSYRVTEGHVASMTRVQLRALHLLPTPRYLPLWQPRQTHAQCNAFQERLTARSHRTNTFPLHNTVLRTAHQPPQMDQNPLCTGP